METTYYHGTSPENLASIMMEGFRLGEVQHGRVHGAGLYIATKPETAAYWAPSTWSRERAQYAFKCSLQSGTKILWKQPDYDKGVIRYLEKKFGKKISRNYDFWHHIPHNKQLTSAELRALVSHLDRVTTWMSWGRKREKVDNKRYAHMSRFSKMIRQYGYDAFGDKNRLCWDDDEILVYNPSRVVPISLHRIDVVWDEKGRVPDTVDYSHPLSLEEAKKIVAEEKADWEKWEAEQDAKRTAEKAAEHKADHLNHHG